MIALIQRVSSASVSIADNRVGAIGPGLLVLLGVERDDDQARADKLLHKVLGYRVFGDEAGKMNLNVRQAGGSLLVVSQFTLAADTHSGLRPGFSRGAAPADAERWYDYFVMVYVGISLLFLSPYFTFLPQVSYEDSRCILLME